MDLNKLHFEVEDSADSLTSPDTGNCMPSDSRGQRGGASRKGGLNREPLEPLIVAALRSVPRKRLLLADIYRYIETNSTDYRRAVDVATEPSSTSAGDGGRRERVKDPAWKIHVRHILSVKRDIFPLTSEKDGKRRGRYHALDEQQYAIRLAEKTQQESNAVDDMGGPSDGTGRTSAVSDQPRRGAKRRRNDDNCTREQANVYRRIGSLNSTSESHSSQLLTTASEALHLNGVQQPDDVINQYLSAAMDGGNSRESWSSTSSGTATFRYQAPDNMQWSTYQQQQETQNCYLQQQQRRHTWPQVETNQWGVYHAAPKASYGQSHHSNQGRQTDQSTLHQYLSAHPHQLSITSQHQHHYQQQKQQHVGVPYRWQQFASSYPTSATHSYHSNALLPPLSQRPAYTTPCETATSSFYQFTDTTSSHQSMQTYTQRSSQTFASWRQPGNPAINTLPRQQEPEQQLQQRINNSSSLQWSPDITHNSNDNWWTG